MGRLYKAPAQASTDFELDLAPLLAVMVKLVPVLLLSSAFVQLMVIESELPQVVQAAAAESEKNPNSAKISLTITRNDGIKITVSKGAERSEKVIHFSDGNIDRVALHAAFVEIKTQHPEVFRVDIYPSEDISYQEIVHVMDEARRARDSSVYFPLKDPKTGEETKTPYMFPNIVFANSVGG